MTDDELKQVLARVAESMAESRKELADSMVASRKELADSMVASRKELDLRLARVAESMAESRKEMAESRKEMIASRKEMDQFMKGLGRDMKGLGRDMKELGQQIGGIGRKFGRFTEGLAFPSMEKILRERFGMEQIFSRVRAHKGGDTMEIDVLAYTNGEHSTAYLVEVKSHLDTEGIQQMLASLDRFPTFFPEHANKELYGILAAVDMEKNVRNHALRKGLFLARIHDEQFKLDVPDDFRPHRFLETKKNAHLSL